MDINNDFFTERDNNFGIISNKIAYYYNKVFNIEIMSLLYKKKIATQINDMMKSKNFSDKLRGFNFEFYILIKDNNKKILKYKLIKTKFNISEYIVNIEYDKNSFDFIECLYYFVDKKLCEYCNKIYMNRKSNKNISNILDRNNEINEDYQNRIIEKYGELGKLLNKIKSSFSKRKSSFLKSRFYSKTYPVWLKM